MKSIFLVHSDIFYNQDEHYIVECINVALRLLIKTFFSKFYIILSRIQEHILHLYHSTLQLAAGVRISCGRISSYNLYLHIYIGVTTFFSVPTLALPKRDLQPLDRARFMQNN